VAIPIRINVQAIEKKSLAAEKGELEIHSIFRTLQGEGPFTGVPAIFVRLAGCNLQCPACDTDYTSQRDTLLPETVLQRIRELCDGYSIRLVVITGGEPFRQDITDLCIQLHQAGYTVQIESNGTLEITASLSNYIKCSVLKMVGIQTPWFNIVCSPKTGKVHASLIPYITAWKYVLSADSVYALDGLPLFALEHSASPYVARPITKEFGGVAPVYLQPCDSKDTVINQANMAVCIESSLKYGYIMQLQTHKYLGID
jgi:7-carboxy-7-deazaguanine synthase